jgi:NAD(P)-dependent dehydrogenase (short-subunit alcohol dehydrogenase family)
MKINQSVVLVSGANRGIGRAFVEALLEMGATRVYATAPDLATLESIARLDRTRVRAITLDVRDPADSRAAVEEAKDVNLLIHRRHRVPRRHTHPWNVREPRLWCRDPRPAAPVSRHKNVY